MLRFALRQALVTLMLMTPALAASPAEQRGKAYASKPLRAVPLRSTG